MFESNDKIVDTPVFVVKEKPGNLLSYDTSVYLNIVATIARCQVRSRNCVIHTVRYLMELENLKIFKGKFIQMKVLNQLYNHIDVYRFTFVNRSNAS